MLWAKMYSLIKAELINGAAWASRPRPWVARLICLDPRWTFRREFVNGIPDYTVARKSGGRGIWLYFALAPGFYEVYRPVSWNERRDERFFIRVDEQGEITTMDKQEVIECLKNAASASAS